MSFQKTNQHRRKLGRRPLTLFCAAIFFLSVSLKSSAQTSNVASGAQNVLQRRTADKLDAATGELQKRLERAQGVKSSGDPARVAHTNELVIALALRELGQVRLLESAYGQAAELYGRSLNFENIADTRVDLAIAHLRAGEVEKAIEVADQALLDDPNNVRAFQVLGRAWSSKNDYPRAAHALVRAAEISPTIENLYSSATALLATRAAEDRKRADQAFMEMVKAAGESGSIHVMFGRAYRDAGDLPAAIREFEAAIRLDTRTPHAHYFLGLAHLAANEWAPTPEVRAEYLKELEIYPRDYLANYMLGFIDSAERRYEEAGKYLKIATTQNPEAPDPWLYLGLNAYAQNDMGNAEEYFRKAIQLTGSDYAHANYQIRRAYIDLGRILATSGRKEEAQPYLEKARELQNRVLQTSQQGMASHFIEEGADTASAAVVLPQAGEDENPFGLPGNESVDPFAQVGPEVMARANLTEEEKREADGQEKLLRAVLAQSFSDLATSDAIRQDFRAAVEHYQEAEHWEPATPGLMRNLGAAAFRAQNYPEAVRGLSSAIVSRPGDTPARAMLGMAYFGEDKYKEAAKTFQTLGREGMRDSAVGYAWAASLARTGDMLVAEEVLKEFEKAERPDETLLLVGQLWIEIGDYEKAAATLHLLLRSNPSIPKAHYFAGQAYLHWEHWEEAAQEFRGELALAPEDVEARYNLGFVYLQQSHVAEAEKLFQEVIAARPQHANAQYEYGKILMDHGEVQDAISHLEIAARLSPQTDFVHYQLQAAYRKEGRVAEADRELEIYKKIKAQKRERASKAMPPQTP